MLIDTHAHLYSEDFEDDLEEVMLRAKNSGVQKILLPNIDQESIVQMEAVCNRFSNCIPMMGLHPGYVKEDWENQLSYIEKRLFEKPEIYCAVGEIGIDLFWDRTFLEEQKIVFRRQVQWAKTLNLPIAIHARNAFEEIFEILDAENNDNLSGVFHCFTGNIEQANHILNYRNFKFGIGGVVTYKNSVLPDVIKEIDLMHIVLETDAPYLPPVPHRGKRNESSFVELVAEKLADIHGVSLQEIAKQTSENAVKLFRLEKFKTA
jgi:TatD DNase family protein